VGQGGLTLGRRGQGPGRAPYVWAYPWLLSTPPSGFRSLLVKYNFLVFLWNCPDLPKYGVLTVLFQQNPDSGSKSSNDHQTCKNRGNNISINSKYEIYQWITVNYDTK
jgi:hypothetical protein